MKGNNFKKKQLQEQIEVEAVVLEEMQECLRDSLEWLEIYIGKTGCYLDWQQRKQLPKTIERENVQFMDANEVKGFFSTVLFSLSNFAKTSGVPFVLERLQTQFYSWLDKSGINADNCPKELAECLVNIGNVLDGKGEEFRKSRREEVRKNISQMTSEEQEGKFYGAITELQKNLKNEEAWLEVAKDKSLQDVKMENEFFGNADRGKEKFELIKKQLESSSTSSSSTVQPNIPQQYIPVNNENELSPEQLITIQQVNQELNQQGINIPLNELIPVAGGGLAFIFGLAGGLSWFKRRD